MLNIGIIGAGAVVQGAHAKALQARNDAKVVAIADPSEAYRKTVGERVGCDRLFADYTARLCGLLSGSRQVCSVAILGSNHQLDCKNRLNIFENLPYFKRTDRSHTIVIFLIGRRRYRINGRRMR